MKVKIELFSRQDGSFLMRRPTTPEGAFPDFAYANISLYEKTCPFCGQLLKNAECTCAKFNNAKDTFLRSFKNENLWLRQHNELMPNTLLKAKEIIVTPTAAPDNALLLFDEGTEAELKGTPKPERWYVSQGEITPRELTFYLRKRGDTQYYLCKIKDLPPNTLCLLKNATKIEVGYTEEKTVVDKNAPQGTLGNYHFKHQEHIVAEYSYNDYLLKLTEL